MSWFLFLSYGWGEEKVLLNLCAILLSTSSELRFHGLFVSGSHECPLWSPSLPLGRKATKQWVGNEAGNEREMVWGGGWGGGERGDADRCWLGWWGEDKGRVVSKWAASPSPTSVSRHSPPALPCTLYPRSYTPSLRSPWEQESSLSALEFSTPCRRADLLTPVPLPSAHHSSSLSPLQHILNECNSYESGSVLLSRLI